MVELIVFGLIVACALLFQRLQKAERRILDLEERQEQTAWRLMALASAKARGEVDETATAEQAPVEDVSEPEQTEPPAPVQPAVTLSRSEPEPLSQPVSYQDPVIPDEPAFEIEEEPARGFDFEEIFGRRLPIWAGGITLAVAGVFLVRYSSAGCSRRRCAYSSPSCSASCCWLPPKWRIVSNKRSATSGCGRHWQAPASPRCMLPSISPARNMR